MNWADLDASALVSVLEWVFVGYFLFLHAGQIVLTTVSMKGLGLRMESVAIKMLPRLSAGYEIPVSIVLPVTGETKDLHLFIQTLFNLDYPEFEVVVVDDTPENVVVSQLQSLLELAVFPEAYWRQVKARAARNVYRSVRYPALRVIAKTSGGLGDAINSGVNAARYPIVTVLRPDCVLRRDSLRKLVQVFSEDSTTVAAGAGDRFTNGRFVVNGFLERCHLPGNPFSWFHIIAHLRRDLSARHGWDGHNAVLTFSDRFCAFRKDAMVQAGGCIRSAANPVWDLLMRIHRLHLANGDPYRVSFLPAPVVWRIPPDTPQSTCAQADHDRHGLANSLRSNRGLARNSDVGTAMKLAVPFISLTEVAGPAIEVLAYAFFFLAYASGIVSGIHAVSFLLCAVGLGILMSWLAILLDWFVFQTYRNAGSYVLLLIVAAIENFGFRQSLALCLVAKSLFRKRKVKSDKPANTDTTAKQIGTQ